MHDSRRLFSYICIDQESDAEKNERDAEPLTHVQNHIMLETHLRFLDELDEEAHAETSDEEGSDEEAAIKFVEPVLVHQDLEDAQKEVTESFIKLCGMLRLCLSPEFENEAPRQRSNISVYLRIEKVSETDECCGKADCDCKMVENPHKIKVILTTVMSCKPPHCNKESYCATMTCQTTFPWHEYFPETLPAAKVIVRLIEEAVPQTGTDYCTDEQSIEKWIKKLLRHSLATEKSPEDEPSENESRDEKYRVPPQ